MHCSARSDARTRGNAAARGNAGWRYHRAVDLRAETVAAPAKLTVSLRVTGVRNDGYHLIDAEMVTLDLCDQLTFDPNGTGVTFTGPYAPDIEPGTDLVSKALRFAGVDAAVLVDKFIPAGGGLGGGSADAAAALRWAGHTDPASAAVLGADIPFCLLGGRARVTGIGEQLEPLTFEARTYTLALLPFGCSTPAVYRAWDDLGGPTADGANDLFPAALKVEPRLALWADRLGNDTGETPQLAGSGSTLFVNGTHPGPDRLVVATVENNFETGSTQGL